MPVSTIWPIRLFMNIHFASHVNVMFQQCELIYSVYFVSMINGFIKFMAKFLCRNLLVQEGSRKQSSVIGIIFKFAYFLCNRLLNNA